MSEFYLLAGALLLLAGLFVVYPWIRTQKRLSAEVSNANVIKQRIDELEREVEEGLIDKKDKQIAIRELKLALVDESPIEHSAKRQFATPVLILLSIPAIIAGVWVYYHAHQLSGLNAYTKAKVDVVALRERMQQTGGQGLTPDDFAVLALSIRDNLRDNPQDISGWSTLALVNSAIGRLDESVAAYEKAVNLDASNDTLRFKYSEALMLAGSEDDLQTAVRQMDYLISKDASNRNYRLLFTTIAIKLQDVALAQQHFEVIKDELDPNSQFYQSITNELSLLGLDFGPKEATHKLESGGISRLVVNIKLDGILNELLPANAYLIVFAQNANSTSKAPLAVKRMPLGDLPTQVELSDSDAMIANMNLSSAQQVNVTARISIDENVMPQAGELQGITNNIQITKGKSQSLDVIINEELQ